jgi:hypothetical protein
VTHEPFQPSDTSPPFNANAATQARIAHALEFIAVQIGEINKRLANEAAEKEAVRAAGNTPGR